MVVGVVVGVGVVGVVGVAGFFRKGSGDPGDRRLAVIVTNFLAGGPGQIRRKGRMGRWGTLKVVQGLGLGLGLAGMVGLDRLKG